MSIWLYSGSFDPMTLGHMDIIKKAAAQCDTLIVGIAANPNKAGHFTLQQRCDMAARCTAALPNVKVAQCSGLLVNAARAMGAKAIVRGVRNFADWEYEMQLCEVNRRLAPELQTLFMPADPALSFISSTVVREMAHHGADLTPVVPAEVLEDIRQRFYHKEEHT